MSEYQLMKGNEALAEAMIRVGADAYFGYPITPQSEVLEYLEFVKATERTGMVVLQAESEVAAVNMLYGAAGCGKRVMTTSSSPGYSLMQEGVSYIAAAELPCLFANVVRGGPGLGTIQASQADYFQATRGGGHGDYRTICLCPSTVQETVDFVKKGFELAEQYRNPVLILTDGAIGQMKEKVKFFDQMPRRTEFPEWATTGKPEGKDARVITTLAIKSEDMEALNLKLLKKYEELEANESMYVEYEMDDAEYMFTGFGLVGRICVKAMELAREKGYKVGVVRPQMVYPFPKDAYTKRIGQIKGILDVEMSAGQMIEDVKLTVNGAMPVEFTGRMGGMIPSPDDIVAKFEELYINGGK
jgi:2-oxoglutarate ferredoxin oxidoreductase subunit alpha